MVNMPMRSGADSGAFSMIGCEISAHDLVLNYTQGNYSLISSTLLPLEQAAFVTTPFSDGFEGGADYITDTQPNYREYVDRDYPIVSRLTSDIYWGIPFNEVANSEADVQEWEKLVSADVARLTLAYSSWYYVDAPVVSVGSPGLVTRYALGPLGVLLACGYLYSLCALAVFITVSTSRLTLDEVAAETNMEKKHFWGGVKVPGATTKEMALNAKLRMADPLSLVSSLYPDSRQAEGRPRAWAKKEPIDLFAETDGTQAKAERVTPRLRIGLGRDSSGRPMYGVWS
jgi:hypothetical protein